ncbi:MAG: 16S rRNA (cytosine(1402)-N(4))-methyltransferase RsmH [FCB group bacterium]|nr:16S rRNA (cytosine(1402)-N(4))-methyltransferase RsmH [FCB group bacterium]
MESKSDTAAHHIPVMVSEVISLLDIHPDGIYLDGTIGLGGHAKQILSQLSLNGRIIGIDLDEEALDICKQNLHASSSVSLFRASYSAFPQILARAGVSAVNGILLDLGLSSLQLDSRKRGFTYSCEGPLDMRFSSQGTITAEELIRDSSEKELARIIWEYGEERYARRIAKYLKLAKRVSCVSELKEAIRRCTPPSHRNRTYARVFQALRIAVNNELDQLKKFLDLFIDYLVIGGRIVILSYHSLEDRLVKLKFRELKQKGQALILTKKPLRPSAMEIQANRRSRSAKLRAAERIA